ncbi:hypothetical protein P3J6_120002 [Pseudoalteromonas sp. 3J6]|nr:hypothetical protein P3J6_120002 [Pseudoalteromonas sp. 3J6]
MIIKKPQSKYRLIGVGALLNYGNHLEYCRDTKPTIRWSV